MRKDKKFDVCCTFEEKHHWVLGETNSLIDCGALVQLVDYEV